MSPQSVTRSPPAPWAAPAAAAGLMFSIMLSTRPEIDIQLEVPGHTQNGTPASLEARRPLVEGVVVLVAPLAHRDPVGELGQEVGVDGGHVAPHEQLAAGRGRADRAGRAATAPTHLAARS